MPRKKRIRKFPGGMQHSNHEILGGKGKVFRVPASGDVWQFQTWISEEKKHLRRSLKTKDLDTATQRAENLYLQTMSDVKSGRKIFGITLKELTEQYVKWRDEDVVLGNITKGRLVTIKSQMKHFLRYKGEDTKLAELDRSSCYEYALWRTKETASVQKVTIRNEQATFNHMMKYAYRVGYSHIDTLDFRKIVIKGGDVGRRDTFTLEEYSRLVRYMRTYVSKRACPDETDRLERLLVRDAILVASNTMLRVGELWNLKWKDILQIEKIFDSNEQEMSLVTINVRAEIAKTRKERKVFSRGGEYLERIRARATHTDSEDFVFCGIGKKTKVRVHIWYAHWSVLMDALGIDYKQRNLTWYSLRHFGITCRIRAGNLLSDISQIAGTSISHIENTYGHYDASILKKTALKNFRIDEYGIALTE